MSGTLSNEPAEAISPPTASNRCADLETPQNPQHFPAELDEKKLLRSPTTVQSSAWSFIQPQASSSEFEVLETDLRAPSSPLPLSLA